MKYPSIWHHNNIQREFDLKKKCCSDYIESLNISSRFCFCILIWFCDFIKYKCLKTIICVETNNFTTYGNLSKLHAILMLISFPQECIKDLESLYFVFKLTVESIRCCWYLNLKQIYTSKLKNSTVCIL